jgi:signal transduction histidine kinase
MKTIVDDVLTMSKLDSGLFVMTPVDVQLDSIARDAVKMFDGEARSAGVDLRFELEDSCKRIKVDNVSLDPTRVLQILIVRYLLSIKMLRLTVQNLITNAIKFTRLEKIRSICVSLGIALEQPTHSVNGNVPFQRTSEASVPKTLQADWEKGNMVNLHCALYCEMSANQERCMLSFQCRIQVGG